MKYILCAWLCAAGCGLLVQQAAAQTLRSSYFQEYMPMRHKLNPALVSPRGYISVPVLGSVNADIHSNIGLTTFLYPLPGGELTTFMNPNVSTEAFLDKIRNRNVSLDNVDLTLLSAGFYAWNGFNTIDISTRSTSNINLPGELFRFMKQGMTSEAETLYQMQDISVETNNYIEIALGHAHPVNDRLTLGGKLKVLLGAGNAQTHIDRMDVTMSGDKWVVDADGYVDVSGRGASFETNPAGEIDKFNFKDPGISGWGLALDLGMDWVLVEDHLHLSGAVTDVGFLTWNRNLRGTTDNQPFIFEGFQNIIVNDPNNPGSFKEQWKRLKDDLRNLVRFYETDAPARRTTMLRSTLTVGLEYAILERKISFGLLSTTRFGLPKIWNEQMLSANFRPCRWFNATLTGSASNYGLGWGWLLNFNPKGVTLFLGSDYMITRVTPQWIPMGRATASVSLGMNIPIGRSHDRWFRPEQ